MNRPLVGLNTESNFGCRCCFDVVVIVNCISVTRRLRARACLLALYVTVRLHRYTERNCADTIGTVLVPWAGHFQRQNINIFFEIKYTEALLSNSLGNCYQNGLTFSKC